MFFPFPLFASLPLPPVALTFNLTPRRSRTPAQKGSPAPLNTPHAAASSLLAASPFGRRRHLPPSSPAFHASAAAPPHLRDRHGPLGEGAVPQLHDRLNHGAADVAVGENLPGLRDGAAREEMMIDIRGGWGYCRTC